jgi:uroporphyrinogen decarboxylase
MNPRDIVRAQINHQQTETIPYTLLWEEDVEKRLDVHYGTPQWKQKLETFIQSYTVVDTMKKQPTSQKGIDVDPYGSLWRMDRRPFHLHTAALAKPDLNGYSWPDPEQFFLQAGELEKVRVAYDQNQGERYLIGMIGWGLFETSWGIRGFENVLIDIACEPGFYEELLDRITEQFMVYIDYTCEQLPEIDAVMFGDDWGDQRGVLVGPERWRKFFKPRYAKIYDKVHAKGKAVISHCCGSIVDIMPDIIDIGLDVLESVQPEAYGMDPNNLKANWGDKIAFWGCLGSQSTLPFGTPEEIEEKVSELCRVMGRGGGFILAPAKELQPETPTENAVALVESLAAGLKM